MSNPVEVSSGVTARHRLTQVSMNEGLQALIDHMDQLSREGWQTFHVHEARLSDDFCFLVFSRAEVSPKTP